jgi:Zn-dependent protease
MHPETCGACGAVLAPGDLACAQCHALVHAAQLKQIAARAEVERIARRPRHEAEIWRTALPLLPPSTKQHAEITAKIVALDTAPDGRGLLSKLATATLAAGLGLWKMKAIVPSFVTMALMFGAYLTAYTWQFALGFVVSLWIHEMGHVVELRRRGLAFSWPMFIPGLGAYVRLMQAVPDPATDARIGLAGPIAGTLAAAACMGGYYLGGGELWFALAQAGALLNLFNLTPLSVLDGGRAFNALTTLERVLVTAAFGVALHFSNNPVFWLPLIGASIRVFGKPPERGDSWTLVTFIALIAALAALGAQPG